MFSILCSVFVILIGIFGLCRGYQGSGLATTLGGIFVLMGVTMGVTLLSYIGLTFVFLGAILALNRVQ